MTHEGGDCEGGSNTWVSWDGKTSTGSVVPDGVYTVRVKAVAPGGDSSEDRTEVGIDTRLPGTVTAPLQNADVAGTLKWVFAPTVGFNVGSVEVTCRNQTGLGYSDAPIADGTFVGQGALAPCGLGANVIRFRIEWDDAFGYRQSWMAPEVPVTIGTPPTLTVDAGAHRYFSPNGDSQNDIAEIGYCLSRSADVAMTVTDAGGDVVRTVSPAARTGGSCRFGSNNSASWDGKNSAGLVVPNGTYTVSLRAVDSGGNTADGSVVVGLDARIPGWLTSPSPGETIGGTVKFVFTPTPGFPVERVYLSCASENIGEAEPGADGVITGTLNTGPCADGTASLMAYVRWKDGFGVEHGWNAPPVPVVIDNPLAVAIGPQAHRYFSPQGNGIEDQADIPTASRRGPLFVCR